MLTLFAVTLVMTLACCALLLWVVQARGEPLPDGCANALPDDARCASCPRRRTCPNQEGDR